VIPLKKIMLKKCGKVKRKVNSELNFILHLVCFFLLSFLENSPLKALFHFSPYFMVIENINLPPHNVEAEKGVIS
jgi:hypothetical protein